MRQYGSFEEVVSIVYRDPTTGFQVTLQPNTSASYSADRVISLPQLNAADTLVSRTSTDTLTNKTLTSPVLTTPNLGTPSALVLTNATGTLTSVTLVTPVLGTPSSGNLSNCTSYPNVTQSVAGLVASAGQLLGTNTNDSASSGNVGQVLSSSVAVASGLSLTSGGSTDITSITLTAGDWDVRGAILFNPGASTSITFLSTAISATSGVTPASTGNTPNGSANGEYKILTSYAASVPGNPITIGIPAYQVKVANAATLTLYLEASATFSVSTLAGSGYIQARRMR